MMNLEFECFVRLFDAIADAPTKGHMLHLHGDPAAEALRRWATHRGYSVSGSTLNRIDGRQSITWTTVRVEPAFRFTITVHLEDHTYAPIAVDA